jgi:hypothetical protein
VKLTSNDCKQYIVDWYAQNRTALPIFRLASSGPLDANGCRGGLRNGLNPKHWKRQAIAKIDNKVYRLFSPDATVVDPSVCILLIEDNGVIESLTVGEEKDFKQYFGKIGYWA